jgi:hypothetical protein
MKKTIAALIVLFALGACADDPNRPSRLKSDDDYMTGSNLPRRQTDATTIRREQIEDMQQVRPGVRPPGGGG